MKALGPFDGDDAAIIEKFIETDFIRVNGKQQLLFRLAEAMLENPDGIAEFQLSGSISIASTELRPSRPVRRC